MATGTGAVAACSSSPGCRPDEDGQICRERGPRIEGWKRRRDFASPQQLDGISNIRSRNVRNAGQSDLSEKEGGEDRRVGSHNLKRRTRSDTGKRGSAKAQHSQSL